MREHHRTLYLLTLRSGGSAGFIHAYKLANTLDPGQVVNVLACVGSDTAKSGGVDAMQPAAVHATLVVGLGVGN
ncbi:hypothetical protein C8J57DRAFT_1380891 [Mycena rebaudengoi]|nr:hypothetical protein C8J57DRAFT_1399010 [Mycena rebaudengoi]KAJ7234237.1 hypothetical protein C8J57DRAFT_1380891 [Mycena rebaudengoi]